MPGCADLVLMGGLLGFSVAAPIGPVGALCISRSLGTGMTLGFVTGLGAATGHLWWIIAAIAGLAGLAAAHPQISACCSILSGALLLMLGWRALRRIGSAIAGPADHPSTWTAYCSGLLLCLSNPTSGLVFVSAVAGLAPEGGTSTHTLLAIAGGTFLGSAAWWLCLSTGMSRLRGRLSGKMIRRINVSAGGLLLALGLVLGVRGAWTLMA